MSHIDQSPTNLDDFFMLLQRNMEPKAHFEVASQKSTVFRTQNQEVLPVARQVWIPLREDRLMPLLTCESFTIEEITDGHILVSIHETSYMGFGYAASRRRRSRMRITESSEDLKELVRRDKALLTHFVKLADIYKSDHQLSGAEAKTAMEVLLHAMYTRQFPGAASFGQVEYTPNNLAWIALFDEIGDQTLGDFLNIKSPEEIPGGDLDARVDQIRRQAGADAEPTPQDPAAMLASAPPRVGNLRESRARRFLVAGNHMARLFAH